MSADGRYIYVSDNTNEQLLVVDAITKALVGKLAIGSKPALMVRSPDGNTPYVSNGGSHHISVLDLKDPSHPTVRATVLVLGYPHGIDVMPDGKYLVVAGATGNAVSVVDANSLQLLTTIYGEQDPNDILVTA